MRVCRAEGKKKRKEQMMPSDTCVLNLNRGYNTRVRREYTECTYLQNFTIFYTASPSRNKFNI